MSNFAYNAFPERYSYIETGYRQRTTSLWNCFSSLLQIHNETVNIWSHLSASLYYLYNSFILDSDYLIHSVHCSTLSVCFMASALFHLLCNMPYYYKFALILDVTGVLCMMTVNVGSAIYIITLHPNFTETFQFYYLLCYLVLGIMGIVNVQIILFRNKGVRGHLQYLTFFCMISYWLPCLIIHFYLNDIIAIQKILLIWGIEYCAWLCVGVLFACNIPNCFLPRRYNNILDYFGNSHNVFHILVVFLSLLHSHNLVTYRATLNN